MALLDNDHLWVASTRGNNVQLVNLTTDKVEQLVGVAVAPFMVICPTADRCFVTNRGGDLPAAGAQKPVSSTWQNGYDDYRNGTRKMQFTIHANLKSLEAYTRPGYPWLRLVPGATGHGDRQRFGFGPDRRRAKQDAHFGRKCAFSWWKTIRRTGSITGTRTEPSRWHLAPLRGGASSITPVTTKPAW